MIIKDERGYKLLVKGADSYILQNLDPITPQPYKDHIIENINNFSKLGFRTLVFGQRYLSQEEFQSIEAKYLKALGSTRRSHIMSKKFFYIEKLALEVEKDLILLGCTAVEDKLQDDVKNSVLRFLEAGIKVWMITGDKLETAKTIGKSCGIVSNDMKVLEVGYVRDEKEMEAELIKMKNIISKMTDEKRKAVVFDMRSLGKKFF